MHILSEAWTPVCCSWVEKVDWTERQFSSGSFIGQVVLARIFAHLSFGSSWGRTMTRMGTALPTPATSARDQVLSFG